MGNWYSQAGRGLVMGVWSSCQSIGNILGEFLPDFNKFRPVKMTFRCFNGQLVPPIWISILVHVHFLLPPPHFR